MKRIYTYMRVSTEKQAKFGESLEDQQTALRRWAEEHGCVILREYVDAGRSASKEYRTRPAFLQMLEDAKREHPDQICFTRLDRFTRNQRDYHNLAYDFDRERLEWCAIWENYDSTTQQGRIAISVMMALFENESVNTSQRIRATNREKRLRGELTSGNMPRGYLVENKKPVKDPAVSDGIHAFWRTYLSGQGMSASIEAAERHGVRLAVSSCSYMLRNAMHYSGHIQGVPCEPYITEAEAAQVLAKRKKPVRKSGRVFLFSGLIRCAECGRAMGGHSHALKEGYYVYYNCTKHYQARHECGNAVNLYERDIEAQLLDQLEDALLSLLEEAKKAQNDPKTAEIMRRRINQLSAQKKRLLDVYLDGIIEKEEFEGKRSGLDLSIIETQQALAELEKKKKPAELRELLPEGWKEMYQTLDPEKRRAFWYSILKEIRISSDRTISFTPQT